MAKAFNITNSWIFDAKRDVSVTLAIFFVAYLIYGIADIEIGILEIAILPILFDQNHVLMTYARVYFDPGEFSSRQRLYISVPIFSLVSAVGLALFSQFWFLAVYGNLSLFHFIRQQYGWLMITTKKARRMSSVELLINKVFFYNLTVTPLLFYFSSKDYDFGWIGPMLKVPGSYETVLISAFWVLFLLTVLYEIALYAKFREINLAKLNQYFVAFVTWFAVHYFMNTPSITYTLLIVSHGLSYWHINYFIMSKKWSGRGGHLLFSYWYSAPLLFFLLCLVTFFYWNVSGLNQDLARHFLGRDWHFMMIIPATVSWTHYILDGFIWKSNRNKSVRKYIAKGYQS